jgi:hypothetical protein
LDAGSAIADAIRNAPLNHCATALIVRYWPKLEMGHGCFFRRIDEYSILQNGGLILSDVSNLNLRNVE